MNSQIRLGIIGAGANTRVRHLPEFAKLGEVTLAGVVNRTEASSRHVAQAYQIAKVYSSPESLIAARHRRRPYRHLAVRARSLHSPRPPCG